MIQKFWNEFLAKTGKGDEHKCAGMLCFGLNLAEAEAAVEQIISGKRRASIMPANGYRCSMNANIAPGQLNAVVDWNGKPRAVIETLAVRNMALKDLTDEMCAMEGICGDRDSWMEVRQPVLKMELEELGEEITQDTMLLVEEFRPVYSVSFKE